MHNQRNELTLLMTITVTCKLMILLLCLKLGNAGLAPVVLSLQANCICKLTHETHDITIKAVSLFFIDRLFLIIFTIPFLIIIRTNNDICCQFIYIKVYTAIYMYYRSKSRAIDRYWTCSKVPITFALHGGSMY